MKLLKTSHAAPTSALTWFRGAFLFRARLLCFTRVFRKTIIPRNDSSGPAPPTPVAPQRPAVLRRGLAPILAMRRNQLDAALRQFFPQPIAVIAPVGDEADRLLPGAARPMPGPYFGSRQASP